MRPCDVCSTLCESGSHGDMRQYRCPRCGPYHITGTAAAVLKGRTYKPNGAMNDLVVAKASHWIRTHTTVDEWIVIEEQMIDEVVAQKLPSPSGQLSNLLRWMSEEAGEDHFQILEFSEMDVCSIIGAASEEGAGAILENAERSGLIVSLAVDNFSLTNLAWERLTALQPAPAPQSRSDDFVDAARMVQLRAIEIDSYDPQRLIRMCEELNSAWRAENTISVAMLARGIADHIPPVFGFETFSQVAAQGPKSTKGSYRHIEDSLRHIADSALHTHIRRRETVPTMTQVDFRQSFDVLLGEVVRQLS